MLAKNNELIIFKSLYFQVIYKFLYISDFNSLSYTIIFCKLTATSQRWSLHVLQKWFNLDKSVKRYLIRFNKTSIDFCIF